MRSFLREVLITVILALIIFLIAHQTIQTFVVVMTSMEPNFHEGERLVVNKAIYYFNDPDRGDVIVFRAPNGGPDDFIKRIIGLPGDTVEVKGGDVYVNGVIIDEPYINNPPNYTMAEETVPEDGYFVLGDNRDQSNDSHRGWYATREDIIGKAWLVTWPPQDWAVVPNYDLDKQLDAAENN